MTELAAKWLRVSSTGQDEQNQEPDEDAWIDSRGYTLALAAGDRGVYRLHGRSASKGAHQAMLDRVVADMAAGKFTVLVVWQSSRIERRGAWNAFDLARRVREAGGRIEYVQDSYLNEANEMSDVMLALAATKDRQKSRDISKQVRSVHGRIDADGALRTRAPFGYAIEGERYGKRLVPTAQGRKLVPQIFAMVADGQSCQSAAEWLEAQTGRKVWPKFIASLIRMPAYYGDLKWTCTEVDKHGKVTGTVERVHHCEPLVDFTTWERANNRLDVRPRRGKATNSPHMLKAVAVCGECGGTLVRVNGNHRGVSPTWWLRCIGTPDAKHARKCAVTPAVMARAESVERTVAALLDKLGYRPVVERTLVHGTDHSSEIRLCERRLRELHRQVAFDDPAYLERQAELLKELARLKALPIEDDYWIEAETGQTFADLWLKCATDAERNHFLVSNGFRVRLWRDHLDMEQGQPGSKFHVAALNVPLVKLTGRAG